MRSLRLTALAVAVLLTGTVNAAEPLTWRVQKATPETWTTAEVCADQGIDIRHGLRQTLAEDERMVLSIRLELTGDYGKDYSKAQVDAKNIAFVAPDGTKYPLEGLVKTTNIVETSWIDMTLGGRLDDDGKPPEPNIYRPLFIVPKTVTAGKLMLGEREVQVTGVPKPTQALDPADAVKVSVKSAKLLDEVPSRCFIRPYKIPGVLRNPFGKILKVEFTLAPSGEEGISYHTEDLTVLTDEGVAATTCGADFMDEIKTTAHNVQGKNPSPDFFFFAVPASTKSFTLLFHNRPVAKPVSISR